jgi:hypothetical protein
VSRLDHIVERNRAAQRRGMRKLLLTAAVLAMLFAIAILLLFTDLGQPKREAQAPAAAPTHVDGVYLGKPKK